MSLETRPQFLAQKIHLKNSCKFLFTWWITLWTPTHQTRRQASYSGCLSPVPSHNDGRVEAVTARTAAHNDFKYSSTSAWSNFPSRMMANMGMIASHHRIGSNNVGNILLAYYGCHASKQHRQTHTMFLITAAGCCYCCRLALWCQLDWIGIGWVTMCKHHYYYCEG